MPTYDYRCAKCGCFEHQQRITEDPIEQCPSCGSPVQRLISRNVGIVFKGSGWYATDSRKPSSVDASSKKTSSSENKAASAETKAEGTEKKVSESKSEAGSSESKSDAGSGEGKKAAAAS